jgi:hypothetical protein
MRARKFEMDKVKLMFHTFVDWRKENDVDNVIDVSYVPFYCSLPVLYQDDSDNLKLLLTFTELTIDL